TPAMRARGRSSLPGALVGSALCLVASLAHADPEWHTGMSLGVAGTGTHELWSDTHFFGALRGDVLFGRDRSSDVGIGPALEIGTVGFSDARLMAGGTA